MGAFVTQETAATLLRKIHNMENLRGGRQKCSKQLIGKPVYCSSLSQNPLNHITLITDQ